MSDNSFPATGQPAQASQRGPVEPSAGPRFLAIGRISKPHGVRGEVRVELLTDNPERFEWLDVVYVGEKAPRPVAVEGVRHHQGAVLIKLAGYPSRAEAEHLRGELLQVPEAEAVPLEEGEYFLFQLQGLEVYTDNGLHLGRLSEVLETGANNVFVIEDAGKQYLVPDIPDVVREIDFEIGRLVISPMPGLIAGLDDSN